MALGNKIEFLMKKRGLSIKQLALQSQVPYGTLYACIKRDSDSLKKDYLYNISDTLGVTMNELFSDDPYGPVPVEVTNNYFGENPFEDLKQFLNSNGITWNGDFINGEYVELVYKEKKYKFLAKDVTTIKYTERIIETIIETMFKQLK